MHKAMVERFQQQDAGKNFDRDYMQQMVEDHKAAVELFETAADDEKLDLDLRSYAKRTLPALREHLTAGANNPEQARRLIAGDEHVNPECFGDGSESCGQD